MPVSERPEVREATGAEPDLATIERLEAGVARLLEELSGLRERLEGAEASYEKLRENLDTARREVGDAGDLEARLERLAEENDRLREIVAGARERADRIRSRLMVVEDEL